jgi:hypothetical protein
LNGTWIRAEKRIKQILLKVNGVVIRRYRIFSPFPRSIKVFNLFGSGFAGLGLILKLTLP